MARIFAAPESYFRSFVTPRTAERHTIQPGRFLPLQRVSRALEAWAIPATRQPYDVLHAFNRIPVTGKPWLVSFESSLPRSYGPGSAQIRRVLRGQLLRPNCGAIIALSHYARRRFELENAGWAGLEDALTKMQVIHPNLPLRRHHPKTLGADGIHLLFVGHDWARKGGVVALRVAQLAQRRGLPIRLTIVSSLSQSNYAQHPDAKRYAPDLKLLSLPNVTHHASLPNAEVLRLMEQADFSVLPTAHDTYGFSVLEGMANATPAIVSQTGALNEIVQDGQNGYVLKVEQSVRGDYARMDARDWDTWDALYTDLANQALQRLETLLERPQEYERLSAGAIERIARHHEAQFIGQQLEQIYDQVLTRIPARRTAIR